MKAYQTRNIEQLKHYNALDCVETARVWAGITADPEWSTHRVQNLYRIHTDLAVIAAKMHSHGVLVDQQERAWLSWLCTQEHTEKLAQFRRIVEWTDEIPVNSNTLRAMLYKRYQVSTIECAGLPDPTDKESWTDEGDISVDRNALLRVLIDPQVDDKWKRAIEMYWAAMTPVKWRSTFIDGERVQQAIGPDGRMRASWNTCGTATGRWSCSQPNLMNLPQQLRSMYVAPEGRVFVHADKSSFEVGVMAAVAQDPMLASDIATGDLYTAIAKSFFDLPAHLTKDDIPKKVRTSAKGTHLGKQYGASNPTVWSQMIRENRKMSLADCNLLCAKWMKRYSRVVEYWGEEMQRVLKQGFSETRVSQRRRGYWDEPELSDVANFPVQGTAADMLNLETIELDKRLVEVPEAHLLFQLHDAVDVECWEDDVEDVKQLLQETMTPEYIIEGQVKRFLIDVKVGKRWSEV